MPSLVPLKVTGIRLKLTSKSGRTLFVLIERMRDAPPSDTFAAVLNDWDEGCTYCTAASAQEALSDLCDVLDEELPDDFKLQ